MMELYQKSKKTPPDHLIDPKKKDKKWILQNIEYIWGDSKEHGFGVFHRKKEYEEYRDYAYGRQSIQQYLPLLDIDDDDDETYMNFNWEIVSLIPKIRDIALGMMNKIGYNVTATATDKIAQDEKKLYNARIMAALKMKQKLTEMGVDPNMGFLDNPDIPQDFEEFEIKKNIGYKHQMEIECEEGFQVVANLNDFENLRKEVKADLFDYGVSGYKEYVHNGKVKIRKIDIPNLICDFTRRPDFSDADYFGEVRRITLAQLKREAGSQLSDEDLREIKETKEGKMSGAEFYDENTNNSNYEEDKILVADIEFKSTDIKVYEKRNNLRGNKIYKKANFEKRSDKERYDSIPIKTWYKGTWIVGSKYIYNEGPCTNINRPPHRLGEAKSSYHLWAPKIYKGRPQGKIEQLAPLADDFFLDWLRLQNLKAQARPNGIYIDIDGIQNVDLGGGLLKAQSVLDLFYKKGTIVFSGKDYQGKGGSGIPVGDVAGGVGSAATELWDSMSRTIELMNQVIGFNELTVGNTVDPKLLKSVAEMQLQSTNHALFNIVDADRQLTKEVADAVIIKIKDILANGGKVEGNVYRHALGKDTIDFVSINKRLTHHDFAIHIEDKPDDLQRQRLEEMVMRSIEKDKITSQAYAVIMNTQNLKVAELLLAYYEEKYTREKHRMEMEKIDLNNQGSTQATMVSEDQKRVTQREKHEQDMEIERLKAELQLAVIDKKGKWDYVIAKEKNIADVGKKELENVGKTDVAEINATADITKATIGDKKKEPHEKKDK